MKYIRNLGDQLSEDQFGAKASSLSRMMAQGFNVPHGFAISKQALSDFKLQNLEMTRFKNEILLAIKQLKSESLIVRSSAIGEDSSTHSFAGQLDSYVVENDLDSIINAIHDCWKGLSNERLKTYNQMAKVDLTEMGVLLQEFIEADFAGVTFTKSPQSDDGMYTEYVKGRGEQLVSGELTPEIILHSRSRKNETLAEFDVNALEKKSNELKLIYGYHLDIEWVYKNGELFIVQARPITNQRSKIHWSNTNLNENYPNPISPLLYSIARDSYYHYFKNLAKLLQIDKHTIRGLEYDFSNAVGIWGNHIYYNMTSIHNILSSSPLKAYFIDAFNKFVGYKDKDASIEDHSKTTSVLKFVWNLIRLNFKLNKYVKEIESQVGEYSGNFLNGGEDKDLFYTFLDIRFNQWYRASVADFFAMIHYKLLAKFTQRFYGEEAIGVHNTLVQAIPDLISTKPLEDLFLITEEIRKVGGGREDFLKLEIDPLLIAIKSEARWVFVKEKIEDYLLKWGFRCSGELMFFSKNYVEDPHSFIQLIKGFLNQNPVDPREVHVRKAKERRKGLRSFVWKIFKKRHILIPISILEVAILLLISRLCKSAISARERVRYKQAEMYFRFKQSVMRLGGEDYFYLTYKEIGELISSSNMFPFNLDGLVDKRKEEFSIRGNNFPEHFATNFGERPIEVHEKEEIDANATVYNGIAASGGQIKGRVVILESVLEGSKIKEGDILVTQQTDPGWAMVFPLIGGLIVERGGALSHGAIVAREFGIPAIVGVKGITKLLQDGDYVLLDGDLGKIQLI